jgi:hypothetical protein
MTILTNEKHPFFLQLKGLRSKTFLQIFVSQIGYRVILCKVGKYVAQHNVEIQIADFQM